MFRILMKIYLCYIYVEDVLIVLKNAELKFRVKRVKLENEKSCYTVKKSGHK